MSSTEPTPEALAKGEDAGEESPAVRARRRTPALAFLIGAGLIGAIGVLLYLFWPDTAQTPATPAEAVITDEALGLPAPDAGAIQAQVDRALREAPRDAAQPAEAAAANAQAQTAPEPDDAAPAPPTSPAAPAPSPQPEENS